MTVEPRDALLAAGQCSDHPAPGLLSSGRNQMAMWWVMGTRRSAPTEAKGRFTEEPRPSSEKPSGTTCNLYLPELCICWGCNFTLRVVLKKDWYYRERSLMLWVSHSHPTGWMISLPRPMLQQWWPIHFIAYCCKKWFAFFSFMCLIFLSRTFGIRPTIYILLVREVFFFNAIEIIALNNRVTFIHPGPIKL